MNRSAWVVALGLLIVGYGTNVSTPFLVLYRDRLDLSDNQTQAIFVVYVFGILATLMLAGQLSDRFGRRPVLGGSLALSALGSLLLIFGRNDFLLIMLGRIVLGVASGAGLGVGAAWLQEIMGAAHRAKAALVATMVTYGGFGLAPPLSTLYEWLGPAPLVVPFIFHIGLTLGVIPIVWTVPETVNVAGAAGKGRWRPAIRFGVPAGARRAFGWYIGPLAVLTFAFPSMGFALFPVLLGDTVDASAVVITGLSGAVTAWAALVSRPLMRILPARTAMGWGAAIGTIGYALGTVAFMSGFWPLVLPAAMALGSASGVISNAGLTLVAELTDDDSRGALSSTFYLLAYVGMSMPLVVSALGGLVGTNPVLVTITVLAALLAATAPLRARLGGV